MTTPSKSHYDDLFQPSTRAGEATAAVVFIVIAVWLFASQSEPFLRFGLGLAAIALAALCARQAFLGHRHPERTRH